MVQQVGDNTYKIELLGHIQMSPTFNVRDLTSYIEDNEKRNEDLR